jgi:hypothetical protein
MTSATWRFVALWAAAAGGAPTTSVSRIAATATI